MEHMEIDQIVEVPDTPDRLTTRHDDRKFVGNPEVADVMYMNEKKERGFPVADTTKNTRLAFRPLKNSCSNYITLSASEKSYPSQNAPIFRRAETDKIFGHGTTHSNGAEMMEKGKTISTNFPSKSSQHGPISVVDLTEENGQSQQMKSAFSHRGSKYNATEDSKGLKASIENSPLPFIADSSNTASNTFAGQCKIENKTLPGPNISVDRGKSNAQSNDSQSQLKTEKQVPLPHRLSTAPRARGQKRLVRNGCISPHNIATKAKQSTEQNSHQTNVVEQSHAGHSVSSNTMSLISVDDIVAEERGRGRMKGKEILIHPSSSGHNAGTIHTASSPVINYEEANDTNNAIRNSLKYSGGQSGWRTTHNHKNTDHHLYDANGHHSRRNDDFGRFTSRQYTNRMVRRDTGSGQSSKDVHGSPLDRAAQATSLIIPEVGQWTGTHPTTDTLNKRQRKRVSTSRNTNEESYNSEIRFLSSSGESSISSSSTSRGFDVELLDLLSECTNRASQDLDDMNNNNSDARARQVEADEILARELQEQLYHEDSFEGGEIDEHLAWELQHEEDLLRASIDNHHISHPTWLPRASSNRQLRSRSHQNPSNRRRAVPQVPSSNRISQLRSRILSRSPTPNISSRGRRPRFPLDMDLDMRLDILEALENAVGDLSDVAVADDIFHAQRDFNEADYEMLLALDEGNHQHTGASANLINSLPQSTIQTDNFTEACAVCLETPVKGEIIRHLPCLHKFHKDCIDPWLHRKTSCPVCKSSIT